MTSKLVEVGYSRVPNRLRSGNKRRAWKIWKKRINVGPGINIGPGKFGKKNDHRAGIFNCMTSIVANGCLLDN